VTAALAGVGLGGEDGQHQGPCCIVCTEPLDAGKHRPAAGSCEHRETCALCFMRLRLLVKDLGWCVLRVGLACLCLVDIVMDPRSVD
jgi:hypothetical protein